MWIYLNVSSSDIFWGNNCSAFNPSPSFFVYQGKIRFEGKAITIQGVPNHASAPTLTHPSGSQCLASTMKQDTASSETLSLRDLPQASSLQAATLSFQACHHNHFFFFWRINDTSLKKATDLSGHWTYFFKHHIKLCQQTQKFLTCE